MDTYSKCIKDRTVFNKSQYGRTCNTPIEMSIISWKHFDELVQDADADADVDVNAADAMSYVFYMFGRTNNGRSITCKVTGFRPYYLVKLCPDDTTHTQIQSSFAKLLQLVEKKVSFKYTDPVCKASSKLIKMKDLLGFQNGREYIFAKVAFTSLAALKYSKWLFKSPLQILGPTPQRFELYECDFDPFLRFCHAQDIKPAGWVKIDAGKYHISCPESGSTNVSISTNYTHVHGTDKTLAAKYLQASFDIEVYSHDYTFPDPKDKRNVVFQIATVYKYHGDADVLVTELASLYEFSPIKDHPTPLVVKSFATERELIIHWATSVSLMDPDVLYTYNGDGFDCNYLYVRAKVLGIQETFMALLSRIPRSSPCSMVLEKFSSSAYGDNEFHRLYIPGRLNYDLLIHYKRGMKKYDSYKLNDIANSILKESKHDVSAKEIFKYFESRDPDKLKIIGEYCIQDTSLLQKLVDAQKILVNAIQLANVTYVPIEYLVTRGQTIKVFSQLLRKATRMHFAVPQTNFNYEPFMYTITGLNSDHGLHKDVYIRFDKYLTARVIDVITPDEISIATDRELPLTLREFMYGSRRYTFSNIFQRKSLNEDSFTGATVLDAKPSYYTDNIAVLDFASLYPTIMISRNICYSTIVLDPQYDNIPGVEYETIEWDDTTVYTLDSECQEVFKTGKNKGEKCTKPALVEHENKYYCGVHDPLKKTRNAKSRVLSRPIKYKYRLVQNVCGVIPTLLEELYAERRSVKRQMEKVYAEGDTTLGDILNSTQLAIKISLNSTYGFLGRKQGNLAMKDLGMIVTGVGRMLILQSKEYTENEFAEHVASTGLLNIQVSADENLIKDMSEDAQTEFLTSLL